VKLSAPGQLGNARGVLLSFTDLQVRLGFVTREDVEGYISATRLAIAPRPAERTADVAS
jgi:hypothetical protein